MIINAIIYKFKYFKNIGYFIFFNYFDIYNN